MAHIKLIIVIIRLILQLLKRMDQARDPGERHIVAKIDKVIKFRSAIEKSGKGDNEELEKMFTIMRAPD